MRKYFLCKYFAELNAFLVEAVHVPKEALEHDLVLVVGEERAHGFGSESLANDDAGRTVAGEFLVVVLVVLAAGEGHDLSHNVGAELLLARAALNVHVNAELALLEANELQGNDIGSLMEQLVEGVLAIGAGLAEEHGAGGISYGLAEAVYGLAVGLHVSLLQVCREAAEGLGIRQERRSGEAEHVSLIYADEGIEKRGILLKVSVSSKLVLCGCAFKEAGKYFRSVSKGKDRTANRGGGGESSSDVIVHEESSQVIAAGGKGRGLARYGHHVLGSVEACVLQRILYEGFVGQGLQGRAGLGYQSIPARTAAASSGSTLLMNLASILKLPVCFAQFSSAR